MEEDEENSEWLLVDTSSKFNLTFFVLILIKFSIIDTWSISIFHRWIYDRTFHIAYEYKDHWDQSLSFESDCDADQVQVSHEFFFGDWHERDGIKEEAIWITMNFVSR